MQRYDSLASFGGRATGKMVGQIPVKEGDSIDPGLSNVNRLPMGFPRPIFQASPPYQKNKHSLPCQGSQFQGFQQLSKISPNNSSTDIKIFNLQLSNVGNDTPQDKTNNPQPNNSNSTHPQFNCPQSIQDKMTANRAVSSSQLTTPRMTEAEEKSCNTWKNIRKSYVQKKVPARKVPHFVPDQEPERKGTAGPLKPAHATRKSRPINSVHTRSYRDRVIHLLALKDYNKSELLVQLQKDGIKINDTNFLGKILLQVANLNATTLSYSLKDSIFKEVQRDWPGYNEEDKQALDLVLSRKLRPFHNAPKATHCKESSVVSNTDDSSSSKDHFHYLSGIDTLMKNKGGLFPPKSAVQLTSSGQESSNSEMSMILPLSATTTKYIPSPLPTSHLPNSNSPLLMKSNHVCSAPEISGTQNPCDSNSHDSGVFERENNKYSSLEAPSCVSVQKKYSKPIEIQHFMPEKFKCTFAKRKTTIPNYITSMMEKQKLEFKKQDEIMKSNSNKEVKKVFPDSGKTCFTSETPDYLTNYPIIISSNQRQCYEKQFKADYSEYQAMYDKIQVSCTPIINLDSERKGFSPGSKEYQDITKKISVAYQKMRQLYPKFCEEKDRCVFLYNKLVHIKKLINDFDQQGVKSTH